MNTPQLFRVSIIRNSLYRTLYPLIIFLFLSINVCANDGVTKSSKNQSTEAPGENEKKLIQTCLSLCEQFEKLARKDTLEAFKAADAIESKLPLISVFFIDNKTGLYLESGRLTNKLKVRLK